MEPITLAGQIRTTSGKGPNRRLRSAGRIPAVLYGHGLDESSSLSLDPRELGKALDNPKGANALITIDVESGGNHTVLVREIQRHPVSRAFLHVDLVVPNPDLELVATVPVNFFGKSPGVSLGGRLRTPYRDIKLRSKPADIPAKVDVDLGAMNIGDTVMASDLALGDGVVAVYERDFIVAKVIEPRGGAKANTPDGTEAAAE